MESYKNSGSATHCEAADPVGDALRESRRRLIGIAGFSGVVNLLNLSGSLYMLQVYDRVIPSRNTTTLAGLSIIVLVAYALQGYFDALRARMLSKIGTLFDVRLQEPIYRAMASLPLRGAAPALIQQPLRDLDQLRGFLSGMGPTAFLDMPWIPIFLVALFVFHPLIGLAAVIGALSIISVTLISERLSKEAAKQAMDSNAQRQIEADYARVAAEVIRALGMTRRFAARWTRINERFLQENIRAADIFSTLGAGAKVLRYILQSSILGIGAYLVVNEQASGGIMIASSIMMGRALAPVEVALSTWKQLVGARQSLKRLREILKTTASPAAPAVSLVRPRRELSVRDLAVTAPGSDRGILSDISFSLEAGMGLAVLGASASGKSSLSKGLVGIWPASKGHIRLDGAAIDQWDPDDFGRHVGYLPQDVCLFGGTVAQNIARFDEVASSDAILRAAQTAGAHDMILRLPQGYSTQIGEGGKLLSAGQRQRIGLARAVFGSPFLVVLDEPNANLDAEGERALANAIEILRKQLSIVIVVSHRQSVLSALDMAMVLREGRVAAFGPKDVLLNAARPSVRQPNPPASVKGDPLGVLAEATL